MVARRKTQFFKPIHEVFPLDSGAKYTGEVGIEIEVEGNRLPREIPSYWRVVPDGSLRGESAEYVLLKPATRASVPKYLEYLNKQFTKAESSFNMSPRTSVHVHVNMNKHSLLECYNYVVLYLILEDLLVEYAGPSRVGNLFCLRARDAEMLVDELVRYVRAKYFNPDPNVLRYTSVNICAIQKFNSVEFRALRGTVDMGVISEWVSILLAVKDAALGYRNPAEIMQDFSMLGAQDFLRKILPGHWEKFSNKKGWEHIVWDSLRLVQSIAYCSTWEPPVSEPRGRLFPVDGGEVDREWDFEADGAGVIAHPRAVIDQIEVGDLLQSREHLRLVGPRLGDMV